MQKWKNKIIFPLLCLIMKIKHHTVFILRNKLLRNIDLFLLWNSKNFHYVLIKDFDSFMTTKAKHHNNNHTKSVLISKKCVLTLIIQI